MSNGRAAATQAARDRMGELSLTQEDLAKKSRTDITTISRFLNEHSWPQVRTRARIEVALGWQPGELGRIAMATPDDDPTTAELKQARQMLINAIRLDDPRRMRELLADALGIVAKALEQQYRSAG